MNRELITRLYHEAADHCVKLGPNPDGTNRAWAWEEKFVELVVKECINICDKQAENANATKMKATHPEDILMLGMVELAFQTATNCYKSHFGIEE